MEVIYCKGCGEYIDADHYEYKKGVVTATMQSPPAEWFQCEKCGQKMSINDFNRDFLEEEDILKLLNK